MPNLTEIIGIVENHKNGLVICSDKDYFVKSQGYWDNQLLNKKVKVTGIVTITENHALLKPDETNNPIKKQGVPTDSWEDYQAQNKQYWIEIKTIEVVE